MNDPVPSQDESEGTRVPASQSINVTPNETTPAPVTLPEQAVTAPPTSTGAPSASSKPAPVLAQPPGKVAAPEAPTGIQPPRIVQPLPVPVSNEPWEPELERSSASAGVDANLMRRVATTESGNNTQARARTSSAKGLFQIVDSTWNDLSAR